MASDHGERRDAPREPAAEHDDARHHRPVGTMVVAGLGHIGLALAADGIRAGYDVTSVGPEPQRIARLIESLAAEDPICAVLGTAREAGRFRLTDAPSPSTGFDVATITTMWPEGPVDPAEPLPVEMAAVALAPQLRPGSLVVLVAGHRPSSGAELLMGTLDLLTGLKAGPDYGLGYAIRPAGGAGRVTEPVIVSGVDLRSARWTSAFHHSLGCVSSIVMPVEAAEFVASLRQALGESEGTADGAAEGAAT